jgi:hypothetical protein
VTRVLATGSGSGVDGVAVREPGPPDEPARETVSDPNATLGA